MVILALCTLCSVYCRLFSEVNGVPARLVDEVSSRTVVLRMCGVRVKYDTFLTEDSIESTSF